MTQIVLLAPTARNRASLSVTMPMTCTMPRHGGPAGRLSRRIAR